MNKKQKAELYEQVEKLISQLGIAQEAVALSANLLAERGWGVSPSDDYVRKNLPSALLASNSYLHNVWDKMSDLQSQLEEALMGE